MDKMREEFEAWYSKEHSFSQRMINAGSGVQAECKRAMLECWQASRAALVVALPDCFDTFSEYSREAAEIATDGCREAIEQAGITVIGRSER